MRLFFAVFALVFSGDRLSKYIVLALLPERTLPVLPGIFHLTLVRNTGVAFGLLRGVGSALIPLYLLCLVGILAVVFRQRALPVQTAVGLALIAAGAAGNLLDRIKYGCVIDFLDLRVWPVFNLADSAITIGALLLIGHVFLSERGTQNR